MPHKDNEYHKKYYQAHKKRYQELAENCSPERKKYTKEYAKKYRTNLKIEILSHYSNSLVPYCACCNEKHIEFLAIDHIDGSGAKHRKENKLFGMSFYRWLKKNNYPEGFQVLCFNCNWVKGYAGKCPHETERLDNQLK
jgi:hypothetical protein